MNVCMHCLKWASHSMYSIPQIIFYTRSIAKFSSRCTVFCRKLSTRHHPVCQSSAACGATNSETKLFNLWRWHVNPGVLSGVSRLVERWLIDLAHSFYNIQVISPFLIGLYNARLVIFVRSFYQKKKTKILGKYWSIP